MIAANIHNRILLNVGFCLINFLSFNIDTTPYGSHLYTTAKNPGTQTVCSYTLDHPHPAPKNYREVIEQ